MTSAQAQAVARVLATASSFLHRPGRNRAYAGTDWAVLRFVADPDNVNPTVQSFAAQHGLSKKTVGPVVEKLVDLDCLERRENAEDRRQKILFLTPKGEQARNRDPLLFLAEKLTRQFPAGAIEVFGLMIGELSSRALEWAGERYPQFALAERRLNASQGAPDAAAGEGGGAQDNDDASSVRRTYDIICALSLISPCFEKALTGSGIKRKEWAALRYFGAVANRSDATLRSFARDNAVTLAAASVVVTDLAGRGYLQKDDRTREITLTPQGKDLLTEDPNLRIAALLDGRFDASELADIERIIEAILTSRPVDRTPKA